MPLPALGELPQLTALSLAWRRLVDLKPVWMLVNNTSLVCCWEQRGRWQQRVVGWHVAVRLAEDRRPVDRRAPDQRLPEGSPGNFVAVAIRIDRLPVRLMAS